MHTGLLHGRWSATEQSKQLDEVNRFMYTVQHVPILWESRSTFSMFHALLDRHKTGAGTQAGRVEMGIKPRSPLGRHVHMLSRSVTYSTVTLYGKPSFLDNPLLSLDNHWDPHRRGGNWGHRSKDAPLLPVWKYCQPHQPYRNHRREGKNQHFRIYLQVRINMPLFRWMRRCCEVQIHSL